MGRPTGGWQVEIEMRRFEGWDGWAAARSPDDCRGCGEPLIEHPEGAPCPPPPPPGRPHG